jgi:putative Holliday junction resolvase
MFSKKKFPNQNIERYDERFTSKVAVQAMIDGGLKKKQRKEKGMIDQVSATLILQSYLDYKFNKI